MDIYCRRVVDLLSPWLDRDKDVIFHLNSPVQMPLGKAAREQAGARVVYTLHFLLNHFTSCEDLKYCGGGGFKDASGDLEIIKTADRVICVTRFAMEVVCTYYGKSASQTCLVYNGCGSLEEHGGAAVPGRSELKKKFGFDPREKIILFVGRIDAAKGCDVLAEAFVRLLERHENIRLVFAGSGNFAECLKPVGLHCAKISFTGKLEKAELEQLYRMADIGIIPSLWEQCSYVALEMMAWGLPVVYPGIKGVSELFTDGVSGCLLPVAADRQARYGLKITPDVIEEKLSGLLSDGRLAARLGENAGALWRRHYHRGVMGGNTLDVYNDLCLN